MPKIANNEKKRTLEIPENAEKLKAAIEKYGLKMTRRDVCDYLRCSLPTAIKWLNGLPYTGDVRLRIYWTSDVVYKDIASQGIEEAAV